jgi:hypothetical protein
VILSFLEGWWEGGEGMGFQGNNVHWVEQGEGIVTFFLVTPLHMDKGCKIERK